MENEKHNQKPAEEKELTVMFFRNNPAKSYSLTEDTKPKRESGAAPIAERRNGSIEILKSLVWLVVFILAVIVIAYVFAPYFEECNRIGTWNC